MGLYLLNAIIWIFGIRSQFPQNGNFRTSRNESSFAASTSSLMMRALAAAVIFVAFMSVILWAAVWLAIRLL